MTRRTGYVRGLAVRGRPGRSFGRLHSPLHGQTLDRPLLATQSLALISYPNPRLFPPPEWWRCAASFPTPQWLPLPPTRAEEAGDGGDRARSWRRGCREAAPVALLHRRGVRSRRSLRSPAYWSSPFPHPLVFLRPRVIFRPRRRRGQPE
jgi:hypothetical protein